MNFPIGIPRPTTTFVIVIVVVVVDVVIVSVCKTRSSVCQMDGVELKKGVSEYGSVLAQKSMPSHPLPPNIGLQSQ